MNADRLVRINANQVLCSVTECGKSATLILHRFLGSKTPARLPYCEKHASEIARGLAVTLPPREALSHRHHANGVSVVS